MARPPEAGPQGPTRLASAKLPWYLALLASDLAALMDPSLSLTSWGMKTFASESRASASVPVTQKGTLAVMSVRVSDLWIGVE